MKFEQIRCTPISAYLSGVTAAAACFVVMTTGFALTRGTFESSVVSSLASKAADLATVTLTEFLVAWAFALIAAALPFAIGWRIAHRLNCGSMTFFVIGGTLTGIVLSPLFALIPSLGINVQGLEPSLVDKMRSVVPMFGLCGAVAGLACWGVVRRTP